MVGVLAVPTVQNLFDGYYLPAKGFPRYAERVKTDFQGEVAARNMGAARYYLIALFAIIYK